MRSLEHAQTLFPDSDLHPEHPCLMVFYPLTGLPEEADVPGRIQLLDEDLVRIGRESNCQIQMKERFVSRVHATVQRLTTEAGVICHLRDGDDQGKPSSNGVFVNGNRLQTSHRLKDEDWIQMGTRVFGSFHEIRQPTPADHQAQEELIDLLQEAQVVSVAQVRAARSEQEGTEMILSELLMAHGWVSDGTVDFMKSIDRITLPQVVGKPPVGEYLKAAGLVTEEQITEAMQLQKRKQVYFGMTLVQRGYLKEETLDFFLRRYGHLDQALQATEQFNEPSRNPNE